ncbi:MAG: hypothetical protein LKI66_07500 [Bifidobacterium tibiigranuli]|jgi:hypothetical protein|nr:hypothetical protein [Bifidobacterium tibiigranuli]
MSELRLFNGIVSQNGHGCIKYADETGREVKEPIEADTTALEARLTRELEGFKATGWKPSQADLESVKAHGVFGMLQVLRPLRLNAWLQAHPIRYAAKQLHLNAQSDPTVGLRSIFEYRGGEATSYVRMLSGADKANRHALTHSKPFTASLMAKVTQKAGEGQSKTFMRIFESPQFCTFVVQLVKSGRCFVLDDWAVDRWGDVRIRFAANRSLRVNDIWQLLFNRDFDMTVCSFENGRVEYAKPQKHYAAANPRILNPAINMPKFRRVLQDLSGSKRVKREDIETFNDDRNTSTLDYARRSAVESMKKRSR